MVADVSFFPPRPSPARSSQRILHTRGSLFCALLHQSETHPVSFQSSPHSLCKTPGCHPERSLFFTPRYRSPLTPVESALPDELRVLPGFCRTSPSATPLESALTAPRVVTPLESALTKKTGDGRVMLASLLVQRPALSRRLLCSPLLTRHSPLPPLESRQEPAYV